MVSFLMPPDFYNVVALSFEVIYLDNHSNKSLLINFFTPTFNFHTPQNVKKISGSLMSSGGIQMGNWPEMG